jgi:ribosomal protein L19
MRFTEIKIFNKQPLVEYDANYSDQQLKDLIVQRLQSEEDRNMLDRIYQALEQSTLDERIKKTLSTDADAKSRLQIFAGLVMNTDGTLLKKKTLSLTIQPDLLIQKNLLLLIRSTGTKNG